MSSSDNETKEINNIMENDETQNQEAQLNMIGQYLKDLSFESPNAPHSIEQPGENPNIQIEISVNGQKIKDDVYEVVLEFAADAKSENNYIYKIEISYAGLFKLQNFPEDVLQQILLITCPTYLYPFLRAIVLQMTREGGFPTLQLDPIDFAALYQNNVMSDEEAKKTIN